MYTQMEKYITDHVSKDNKNEPGIMKHLGVNNSREKFYLETWRVRCGSAIGTINNYSYRKGPLKMIWGLWKRNPHNLRTHREKPSEKIILISVLSSSNLQLMTPQWLKQNSGQSPRELVDAYHKFPREPSM